MNHRLPWSRLAWPLWSLLLCLLMAPAYAQEAITVTGTVTAKEDASPLPGMTVILKGSSRGLPPRSASAR